MERSQVLGSSSAQPSCIFAPQTRGMAERKWLLIHGQPTNFRARSTSSTEPHHRLEQELLRCERKNPTKAHPLYAPPPPFPEGSLFEMHRLDQTGIQQYHQTAQDLVSLKQHPQRVPVRRLCITNVKLIHQTSPPARSSTSVQRRGTTRN